MGLGLGNGKLWDWQVLGMVNPNSTVNNQARRRHHAPQTRLLDAVMAQETELPEPIFQNTGFEM